MNKYKIVLLSLSLAVATLFLTNCTQNEAQATVVDLPTMQCEACAQTITKAAESVEGVESVQVSVENKQATIKFSSSTDLKSIEKAIAESGYQANKVTADGQAYKGLPDCCKVPEDGESNEHVM